MQRRPRELILGASSSRPSAAAGQESQELHQTLQHLSVIMILCPAKNIATVFTCRSRTGTDGIANSWSRI